MLCSVCQAIVAEDERAGVAKGEDGEPVCARCVAISRPSNVQLGPRWPPGMAVRRESDGTFSVYLSWTGRDLAEKGVNKLAAVLRRLGGQRTRLDDIADLARESDRDEIERSVSLPKRRLRCYACGEPVSYIAAKQGRGLLDIIEPEFRAKVHKALELDEPEGPPHAFDEDRPVVCPPCVSAAMKTSG